MKPSATARPAKFPFKRKNKKGKGNAPTLRQCDSGAPTKDAVHRPKKQRGKSKKKKQPPLGRPNKRYDHSDYTCQSGIGETVEDDDLVDPDRLIIDDFPFTTTFLALDTGEADSHFLMSMVGADAPPPSPPTSSQVHGCLGITPSLALETHNLPADRHLLVKVEDPSIPGLYPPSQTAVNNLSSANLTLDLCQQSPLLDDTMSPPSATTIEECRRRLVPVLLASVQARDPGRRFDSEQCRRLLSDDHCRRFIRQATEMRRQLSSLVAQKTPVYQGWSGSSRRDDVDAWVRHTRGNKYNSVNTAVSDVLRRDSDITLVDFPGGKLPPKAPRAMLLASQATRSDRPLNDASGEAPIEPLVASPTTEDYPAGATSLAELVHQAVKNFPTLMPTTQPMTEIDTSNMAMPTPGTATAAQSRDPLSQVVSPIPAVPSSCTDFVLTQPTQPGVWFSQRGRQHAEIVDIDIEISDEMFCTSKERLRMHLRLCSVPVDDPCSAPTSPQQTDGVTERHAFQWPKKGKLVVQVNPDSERTHTWLPYTLESDPLDVTSCMQPGKNTFRFIQLSDLSAFTFILDASPLPPEEEWRNWDWAALVASGRTSSSTDDPMNGLSEFEQIGVVVRS